MSGAKHTPGPWVKRNGELRGADGSLIMLANSGVSLALGSRPDPTDVANTKLLWAAPEMLAALEEIAASHVPDQPLTQDVDDYTWALQHVARLRRVAQAALAKARGA